MYNFTNITNKNTTLELIQSVNYELTGGMFSLLIIIALGIIIFMSTQNQGIGESFILTNFILSIVAGLFWVTGLLSLSYAMIFFLLSFISILYFVLTN